MRVIVFNVAAESGGALTILKKYYSEALNKPNIEWHFILSTPELISKDNVYVHNYEWVKKSWVHRLFFDFIIANRIVEKLNGDTVLSLQNIVIPFIKVKQVLYFHQILPFTKKRFGLIQHPKFWVYQNVIGKLIIYSVKKANIVIVQANWIKNMFIKDYNVNTNKLIVQSPDLNINVKRKFEGAVINGTITYFYPASAAIYKNHSLIVRAVNQLINEGINEFVVIFTITGDENSHIRKIKSEVSKQQLPVKFVGNLDLQEVYSMYSKSILLFPSFVETIGLPLLEAKEHETPIIAPKLDYSIEILMKYDNVTFYEWNNLSELVQSMKNAITVEKISNLN